MSEVCVNLSTSNVFVVTDLVTALMIQAATEFGQQCSILSTVNSFMNDDLKDTAEDAYKSVMNASKDLYNTAQDVIKTYNYLTDVGIAELNSYLDGAYNIIFTNFLNMNTLMNTITGLVIDSVNTVATAACNTLNEAVTGLPSDVKIQNAGLAAAAALNKTGKPQELIRDLLNQRGIKDLKKQFSDAKSALNSIPRLPNLPKYVCVPV